MTRYILLKDGTKELITSCSVCTLYDKPHCIWLGYAPDCERKSETPDECWLPEGVK